MSSEEDEYGKMTFIYISEEARRQLERSEGWWRPIACGEEPSAGRPVKTRVPASAVEHGIFHPDRYEPELVLEWCETVEVKPPPGMKPLRKGDRVRQTLHGPGATVSDGYEGGTVVKVSGGRAYVHWDGSEDEYSPNVYDPATGHEVEPPIPGFTSRIMPLAAEPAAKPDKRKKAARKAAKKR